jgi:anhydro-N-acetylmuramic acid kinase
MFGSNKHKRILINIGGIANISILLNKKSFFGYDIGPGNALLDAWIAKNKQEKYDNKGEWSKSGKPNMKLLKIFKSDPFFKKTPPKSTGSHDFNLEWILSTKKRFGQRLLAKDIQATLTLLTAELIVDAINKCPKDSDIAFSGGGIKNLSLMALIKNKLSGRHIQSTTDWGIAPEWVEAAGFAFLAHQRMQAKPVELTKTTGSKKKSVLGAIYLPPQ